MTSPDTDANVNAKLKPLPLPEGISSHYINCRTVTGLTFHILSAGRDLTTLPDQARKPLILLHHGYPEMAFSWRKIMLPLAQSKGPHGQGYHVVALDQRGFGRTTGWEEDAKSFDQVDMGKFTLTNLVRDSLALIAALGYTEVKCIAGHDFGAVSSSYCAVARPDVFKGILTMSHPFTGPPEMPLGHAIKAIDQTGDAITSKRGELLPSNSMDEALARLEPPRKHYKSYNITPQGVKDWNNPTQDMKTFLRGYFHLKSADWKPNEDARPLEAWTAEQLSLMPGYYIMPLELSMPETVAKDMQGEDESASRAWLSEEELAIYAGEWSRTGFTGAISWYRAMSEPRSVNDQRLFAGRKIKVPSCFISGAQDWGSYQQPGALERQSKAGEHFRGNVFVQGAGHWVQQEQPEKLVAEFIKFLDSI